jgi:hypothetical protein
MIEPTASLTLSTSTGTLTFSGVDDDQPFGLVDMNTPSMVARITYAATSAHVHGALPTASVWEQTSLAAVVKITGATAVELADREAELKSALGQFSYTATQTVNGVAKVWSCHMGSMAPVADLRYEDLRRLWQTFNITIPVHPLEA